MCGIVLTDFIFFVTIIYTYAPVAHLDRACAS